MADLQSGINGQNRGKNSDVSGMAVTGAVRDPDLAAVVAAWPALPPAIRAGILAMVNAAGRS
jgi:hypothetical protein